MLNKKIKIDKIIGICSLAITIWGLGNLVAIAQTSGFTPAHKSTSTANGLPSNRGAGGTRVVDNSGLPDYRSPGGSRGNCLAQGNNLTALIPNNQVNVTASAAPKLFFYIPETKEQKTLEFVLRDHNDQLVHEVFLQTTGQSGIMNVEIPQNITKSLEESQANYHWYLSMICDADDRADDVVLQGKIGYVELENTVKQKLANSSPAEQADFLQQEGIWYDALSVVAKDSDQVMNSAATEKWTQMLTEIGLSEFSTQPFINGEIITEK
ncbi:MAG: DUF928 domain-containing protein [Xenococcus sp. (in: cyanobacteria)]